MKFEIGDKVLLIHSKEEGYVTDIVNNQMVLVDVDGTNFPVYTDQIEYPYFKNFTEKKSIPNPKKYIDDIPKEKGTTIKKIADGLWLNFIPVSIVENNEVVIKELKLYLINRTDLSYQFEYQLKYFGFKDFELLNLVHPFSDFFLHNILLSDINDSPQYYFNISLVKPDITKEKNIQFQVKLKAKQIFERFEKMQEKNEASFAHLLFKQYPNKKETVDWDIDYKPHLQKPVEAKKFLSTSQAAKQIIDLHIEKLTSTPNQLNNFEIVSLQLNTFEKYFHLAVMHHLPHLIVIHGIGEGKLKQEIHDILKTKPEVKNFVNQYHPLYGFGATEIFFY